MRIRRFGQYIMNKMITTTGTQEDDLGGTEHSGYGGIGIITMTAVYGHSWVQLIFFKIVCQSTLGLIIMTTFLRQGPVGIDRYRFTFYRIDANPLVGACDFPVGIAEHAHEPFEDALA